LLVLSLLAGEMPSWLLSAFGCDTTADGLLCLQPMMIINKESDAMRWGELLLVIQGDSALGKIQDDNAMVAFFFAKNER
jgi:hypothetical protein